jgi:hypothetical protein
MTSPDWVPIDEADGDMVVCTKVGNELRRIRIALMHAATEQLAQEGRDRGLSGEELDQMIADGMPQRLARLVDWHLH